MGNCFCCKNASVSFDNSIDDKNEIKKPDIANSPTNSTVQPILGTSTSDDKHQISAILLCDENTNDLCCMSKNIIDILSIYHLFIHNFNTDNPSNNSNICELINNKFKEYTLNTLREEYHHLISYHNSNTKFMTKLFNQLMQLNNDNNIENLIQINIKLDNDKQNESYFAHKIQDDISIIQTLNQIHDTCINKYKSIVDAATYADNKINDKDPEIDIEDHKSQHNGQKAAVGNNVQNNYDDEFEQNDNDALIENGDGIMVGGNVEQDNDKSEKRKIGKLKGKNKIKIKGGKSKSGYRKSKTKDVYEHEHEDGIKMKQDVNIDVRYNKDEKKKRKVGRLKKRKISGKKDVGKYKAGNQKIMDDDAWMKKQQKRSKHVPSESIQMLKSANVVSRSSLKSELNAVNEDGYDLSNMDLDIDLDDLNIENQVQRKKKTVGTPSMNSMFDDNYDIDDGGDDEENN